MKPTPKQLLVAAFAVLTNDEPVLAGRRLVTAAALARQAIEDSIDNWLDERGLTGHSTKRQAFLCLTALHPEPELAQELHNVWAQLSGACHAISYDLPPTSDELERWMAVADKFISDSSAVESA